MKYVKMLGLLAIAVAALMAFAGSASAATLTSPTGTVYNGALTVSAGATSLDGAFSTVTCNKSHVTANLTSQGTTATAKFNVSTLDFTECNFPTKVEAGGTLELHAIKKGVTPHATCDHVQNVYCNGTLTSSGAKVTITTSVGTCTFTTTNTPVGISTGTDTTGGKAKLDIAGNIPRTAGNFLCGSSGVWTGSYTIDSPSTLWLDE
jgi:hypothetical protein